MPHSRVSCFASVLLLLLLSVGTAYTRQAAVTSSIDRFKYHPERISRFPSEIIPIGRI